MNTVFDKFKKSDFAEKITLIVAFIILLIAFSFLNPNYFSVVNLMNILVACSLMGFVAIGETYLIIAGQIDMSAGALAAFAGVLAGNLLKAGVPPAAVVVFALAIGAAVGVFNATLINIWNIQPFIATLATMSIIRGFAYIICEGKPVSISNSAFINIGTGRVFNIIPLPVIILVIAFIIFGFILARTYFGRSVYVIGGSPYAARLAGINPIAARYKLYIISGCLAALAGLLLSARMNSGQPSAANGVEFDAITGVVLGGTAFTGGVGTILGTLIGMLILQSFNTGLVMLNVQVFWQNVAKGVLLVVALVFDFYRKQRQEKKVLTESLNNEQT
ncbi:MAG: ABC transporter permease [Treponema sp.]|jgi:ribose transport system permease protein|nr:ABC transporter permease [Treponema sp.]